MLLLVASSVMVYVWNMSVTPEYVQQAQEKVIPEIDGNNDVIKNINPDVAGKGTLKEHALASASRVPKRERDIMCGVDADENHLQVKDNNEPQYGKDELAQGEVKENVTGQDNKGHEVKGGTQNKKYTYTVQTAKKNRKWSVAVNSGGLGSNSTSHISGAMMRFSVPNNGMQSDAPSSSANEYSYMTNFYLADYLKTVSTLKTKKKHYQPITFGISFKFDLDNDWAIETGLTYSYLLSKLESGSIGNIMKQEQSLKYLGVPVKLSRHIVTFNKLNLYGSAGGEIESCISGKLKTIDANGNVEKNENIDISQLQLSLSASLGAEYKLTNKLGLYVEPGIGYYFDDKSGVETIRSEHPLNFNLKLGLRFTFSK